MEKKYGFKTFEKTVEFSGEQKNYRFRGHSKLYVELFSLDYDSLKRASELRELYLQDNIRLQSTLKRAFSS